MGMAYRNPLNRALAILAGVLLLSSCAGRQSVLDPAGIDALSVYDLARVMFIGAIVLWLMVGALFIYATRIRPQEMPRRTAEMVIIGGGLVFPVLLLSGLLVYSLPMMGAQRVADDGMRVHVTAEQWWWRVEYELPGGERIVSANELRLPVGARTGLVLNAKKSDPFLLGTCSGGQDRHDPRAGDLHVFGTGKARCVPWPMRRILRSVPCVDGV